MSTRATTVTGRDLGVATGLIVLGVLSGLLTLGELVAGGPWLPVALLLVLAVATVTASVRRVNRSPAVASAWGLVTSLVLLTVVYAGVGTSPAVPLPTGETLERFVRLARSGIEAVGGGHIPVEPVRGIELLVVTGALAAYLVAELVAIGLGRAGLSGLAVLGLWAPALVFERIPPAPVLLLGGGTYLLLLAVTRPQSPQPAGAPSRDGLRALGAAAAVTVLAVLAGPIATAAPFFGAVRLPATWGPAGVDGPLRLSTDLDMRASLGERSDRPILTYTTDAAELGPLRMFTITDFDGTQWQRGDAGPDLGQTDGVLWPDDAAGLDPDSSARVSIQVGDLDEDRLPIPIDPRSVEVRGAWLYDAERDEVLSLGGSTRDASYVVTVGARDLAPDVLRLDGPGDVYGADSPYLALPGSAFEGEIRTLALELTAEATSTYDRAVALQSYFRSIENFRYDTSVPPAETEDAVWDFLTQRTGYCVQFATAMTIMARTLGIPARLGVGFLPGRPSSEVTGEYVVSGRQAHAWPELYFADAGWVRFEPTPATQTGAPPVYADPFAGLPLTAPTPTPTASGAQTITPAPSSGTDVPGAQDGTVGIGSATVPLVAVVGVGGAAAVLLTLALTTWWVRHRRRTVTEPVGADAWWAETRSRLAGLGVTWSDSTTPRQAAVTLHERYAWLERHTGGPAEVTESGAALDRLVAAVEDERYAPTPTSWEAEQLGTWVEAVVRPFTHEPEAGRVDAGLQAAGSGRP